ncbi:hypothetical protein, partial [Pseudomonas syringae]|uniref:hypothetical protein n=3 Tax=Pseudomonas syringae TaxID=317 RepID=UPI0011429297
DQRQDSAVTYVALCVVSTIALEKHFVGSEWWVSHNIVFASEIVDAERHELHSHAREERELHGRKLLVTLRRA